MEKHWLLHTHAHAHTRTRTRTRTHTHYGGAIVYWFGCFTNPGFKSQDLVLFCRPWAPIPYLLKKDMYLKVTGQMFTDDSIINLMLETLGSIPATIKHTHTHHRCEGESCYIRWHDYVCLEFCRGFEPGNMHQPTITITKEPPPSDDKWPLYGVHTDPNNDCFVVPWNPPSLRDVGNVWDVWDIS